MDNNKSNIDELTQFIEDARQGKYNDNFRCIEEVRDIRCDYQVVENVNGVSDSVILYGLSY